MPEIFAETPDGLLLAANGHNPMLRWDGLTSQMEEAGVQPPSAGVTLASSGVGGIVGTYFAYLRFVDRLGNFSNLSPISSDDGFVAEGSTGTVTGATNATPIVITSVAHGLTTGRTVKIKNVGGNTAANGTHAITVLSADTFSLNNVSGNGTYDGGGTWQAGQEKITYSSVAIPQEAKVVRRQILRNTDGQADTFYVDVDTTDLSSSTFESTRDDTELSSQTAVAILDDDGNPLANRYTVPPDYKSVIAHHVDRMYAAVDREHSRGIVQVTNGSATVTGINTGFTASMVDRRLYVNGATKYYDISAVDTANQTLTLTENYQDDTDKFASYAIRVPEGERRLVYFSESGLPEAWPAINALSLPEDNDFITGLMPFGSFLYILEKQHIYKLTTLRDPAVDGAIFLSANRGCINQRCWVLVDGTAYLLDEEGVHAFGGGPGEPVSEPIADLFSTTTGQSRLRVNWDSSDWFHAMHFPPDTTMRWFVALDGETWPRHAICYNYRDSRWWLEEFPFPIGGTCVGFIGNVPQMFLGASAKRVLAYGAGSLDGPDGSGTLRGTVTSSTWLSLSDSLATFASGLAGYPISIVAGTGKGQDRTITAVSGTKISVGEPWTAKPDTTSVYQIGGVRWLYRGGWYRFVQSEMSNVRRLEIIFQPLSQPATFDLRWRADFSDTYLLAGQTQSSEQGAGIETTEGNRDHVCDLTKANGLVQSRLDGQKEFFLDGLRYTQIELEGVANKGQTRIYDLTYDGVLSKGSR